MEEPALFNKAIIAALLIAASTSQASGLLTKKTASATPQATAQDAGPYYLTVAGECDIYQVYVSASVAGHVYGIAKGCPEYGPNGIKMIGKVVGTSVVFTAESTGFAAIVELPMLGQNLIYAAGYDGNKVATQTSGYVLTTTKPSGF